MQLLLLLLLLVRFASTLCLWVCVKRYAISHFGFRSRTTVVYQTAWHRATSGYFDGRRPQLNVD
jgi:hypothetical protein